MMRVLVCISLCVSLCFAVSKDEYLVSGISMTTSHPFGLSPDIMDGIAHDKCAVSIPVPGNDDSLVVVALGIDRAIWLKRFDGDKWGAWTSLQGVASSGPTAIKDEKDQLHIFIRGIDGLIWHIFEKDNVWSQWSHLGNVTTTSGPVAVVNSEGLISVFAIGSNKAVWVNTQEGLRDSEGVCTSGKNFPTAEQEARAKNAASIIASDSGFNEDGGSHKPISLVQTEQAGTVDPTLVSNATAEANREWARIDALKTSSDPINEIKFVWSGWENLGGVWTSKPAVSLNHEGLLSVYVRGPDRALYVSSQETSSEHGLVWSDWIFLNGSFASVPKISAITTGEGLTVLTARGMDKSYYQLKQVNADGSVDWGKWEPVGGLWSSGPTVISPLADTLELFGLGLDLSVWRKTFSSNADGDSAWSAPEHLNGRFSTGVSVTKDTSGLLSVFTRGFDQSIWTKAQFSDSNSVAVWGNWTVLQQEDAQKRDFLSFPC